MDIGCSDRYDSHFSCSLVKHVKLPSLLSESHTETPMRHSEAADNGGSSMGQSDRRDQCAMCGIMGTVEETVMLTVMNQCAYWWEDTMSFMANHDDSLFHA